MFAALFFETDPMSLGDLPAGILVWIQVVGSYALLGSFFWLLLGLPRMRPEDRARIPTWQSNTFVFAFIGAVLLYIVYGIVMAVSGNASRILGTPVCGGKPIFNWNLSSVLLTLAGICGLTTAGLPFVLGLSALRFRRIYALAKLSFKEAIRRRVLYVFAAFLLVILFASWFIPAKPTDQVRSYVWVVYFAMSVLLILAALIVTAFSIPNDVRQQTLHTVVTKPVERFEVVLGRFLGFYALLTLVLVFVTAVGVLYIVREVNPEAAAESLKARVPLYGQLFFKNTRQRDRGISVGREWEYRSYISGAAPTSPNPPIAVYEFSRLPSSLKGRNTVLCEFTFDVYRTTKGEEGKGVACEFTFKTRRWEKQFPAAFEKRLQQRQQDGKSKTAIRQELNRELGFYQRTYPVTDYRTQTISLPGWLFDAALEGTSSAGEPLLTVEIKNIKPSQYVGMARYDLYLRADDHESGNEKLWFMFNFFKGAFGIWLWLGLIIGLAVCMSTYLGGVISLLLTLLLVLGGFCQDFICSVAAGQNVGGGPMESLLRLSRREVGTTPLEESATVSVIRGHDYVLRLFFRRMLEIIPDMQRFWFGSYVEEGFSIGMDQLLIKFLLLVGYLLPWGILAFYLIRWREVAGAT